MKKDKKWIIQFVSNTIQLRIVIDYGTVPVLTICTRNSLSNYYQIVRTTNLFLYIRNYDTMKVDMTTVPYCTVLPLKNDKDKKMIPCGTVPYRYLYGSFLGVRFLLLPFHSNVPDHNIILVYFLSVYQYVRV